MNNVLKNQAQGISNLFELDNISNSIITLKDQIHQISINSSLDKFERKIRIRELNEEISFLKSRLLKGISIEQPYISKEIQKSIITFLEQHGFETKKFEEKIKKLRFYVTNERLSSNGLLATYSDKVAIDYSLVNFDENGNFIGLKKEKEDFIRYALTHEFLHVCSINSNVSFKDDAISEGYTDLFAHVISGNNKDKSERYDYFVRVCTLFTNLVGIEGTVEDYFYNLETMPNLKKLFKKCGLQDEDYFEFYQLLNNIINLQIENENNENIIKKKKNLINRIKEYILIPYLKTGIDNKENYLNLFNDLFKNFNISCYLDEVNAIKNQI